MQMYTMPLEIYNRWGCGKMVIQLSCLESLLLLELELLLKRHWQGW